MSYFRRVGTKSYVDFNWGYIPPGSYICNRVTRFRFEIFVCNVFQKTCLKKTFRLTDFRWFLLSNGNSSSTSFPPSVKGNKLPKDFLWR